MSLLVVGIAWYAVFLFSTTCHEAAHALVAYRLGDPTAYHGGQVSLNPLPHIRREPFGMVLLPIFSFYMVNWVFGWASTPYNPGWARTYPKRAALMALAGPVSNLILMTISGALLYHGLRSGLYRPIESLEQLKSGFIVLAHQQGPMMGLALLLSIFFLLNFILLLFNLLPLPPLDGSGVLSLVLPDRFILRYNEIMAQPIFAIAGLLIAWKVFPYILWPLFDRVMMVIYPVNAT